MASDFEMDLLLDMDSKVQWWRKVEIVGNKNTALVSPSDEKCSNNSFVYSLDEAADEAALNLLMDVSFELDQDFTGSELQETKLEMQIREERLVDNALKESFG